MVIGPPDMNDLDFVEVDPTGRYGRYNEILGKGSSKTVYKAFDEYEGIEVAWNQVKLYDFLRSPDELERLYCEIHLLKNLKHKNIMNFYTSWVDTVNRNINFVTEMFTSGTLRQYRQKHKRVNIRAVKKWCRQILKGLLYLHSHDPPVIHRDLKCDNIFVNGNQGEVKIGDLGLAAVLRKSHAAHCVGTPEFMAPEVYEEEYNELVDIYSFGMCLLEMVTFEYPYSECTHPAQIYKRVTSGTRPEALYRVDPEVRRFVEKCLATVSERLPARELLKDPFLHFNDHGSDSRILEYYNGNNPLLLQPLHNSICCHDISISQCLGDEMQNELDYDDYQSDTFEFDVCMRDGDDPSKFDISIKGRLTDDSCIFFRLRIADTEDVGHARNIYFPFDIQADTALSVAAEMVSELNMADQDVTKIAQMIDGEIASLLPDCKTGEETRDECVNPCHHCSSSGHTDAHIHHCCSSIDNTSKNANFSQCTRVECAAMHGRFEEITYQVEGSEQYSEEETSMTSSQSDGSPCMDSWATGTNMKACNSFERTQSGKKGDKFSSSMFKKKVKVHPSPRPRHRRSFSTDSSDLINCLSSYPGKDEKNEIRRELSWLKAKYNTEKIEPKSQQNDDTVKGTDKMNNSPTNRHVHKSRQVKFSWTSNNDESENLNLRNTPYTITSSCRDSETQRVRVCVAKSNKESGADHLLTGGSSLAISFLPHTLHRAASLPIDAFDF